MRKRHHRLGGKQWIMVVALAAATCLVWGGLASMLVVSPDWMPARLAALTPTVTHLPVHIPSSTPRVSPSPTLAGQEAVVDDVVEGQEPIINLKQELYFGGCGGGEPDCRYVQPPQEPDLPAIIGTERVVGELGALCLFGFPLDEELAVHLYAPNGDSVGSKVFSDENLSPYDIQEVNGVAVIRIRLWWPAGLPTGEWHAVVRSVSTYFEGSFTVEAFHGPAISTLPDFDINPFENRMCESYSVGEQVIVLGTGFAPNRDVPLGVYYQTEAAGEFRDYDRLTLVYGKTVATDNQGNFSTSVPVDITDFDGTYFVVAVMNDDSDEVSFCCGVSECVGPPSCFVRVP